MIDPYKVVIDTKCLEIILTSSNKGRRILLQLFDSLASNPYQKGQYVEMSPSGREYQIKVIAPFIVTYWTDHAVRQVQIVKIAEALRDFR